MSEIEPSVWSQDVPYVADGDAVNEERTNAPIKVLADRTAALKTITDAIEAGQQLLLRDAPLAEGVEAGHVVYLNLTTLHYDRAQAIYASLISESGRLTPSDKAIFSGVVVSKASTYVGDILLSGLGVLSNAAVATLFGGTPELGIHYLSALNVGTVTATPPLLMIRVIQYAGSNIIRVFPPDFEPTTHSHREYTLFGGDWELATAFDPNIVPDGATYGYSFTTDRSVSQLLGEVLLPAVGEGTFVWRYTDTDTGSSEEPGDTNLSGRHVNEDLVFIDQFGIWWKGLSAPSQDIELTISVADAKGESLIHTIGTLTEQALRVEVTNGRCFLSILDFTEKLAVAGDTVVKNIVGRQMQRGLVVEKIRVGENLRISPSGGQGTVTIELAMFQNHMLEADIHNLNNAVITVEGAMVLTQFPVGRTSSMTLKAKIPYLVDPAAFDIVIYALFLGTGTAVNGPVITAQVCPTPTVAGVSLVTPAGYPSAFPAILAGTLIYLLESPVVIDATALSQGLVFYTLSADEPTHPIKVLSTGILLRLK